MNILEKLIQLANKLDSKGLYKEADMLDEIIKESQGYRELIAPGLTGPEDPSRMAPGAGAGGLPTWSPPAPSERPIEFAGKLPEKYERELDIGLETGVAGKGKIKRNPKVAQFQKQYNDIWTQLNNMGMKMRAGFGPPLAIDGLWGPKTARARKLMPRLKNILQGELREQTIDFAGKLPENEKELDVGIAGKGPMVPGAGALMGEANKLRRELMLKGQHVQTGRVMEQIQNIMGSGVGLEEATQKLRQQYGL